MVTLTLCNLFAINDLVNGLPTLPIPYVKATHHASCIVIEDIVVLIYRNDLCHSSGKK